MYNTLPPYLQQEMGGIPPWHLMRQQPQQMPIMKPNITLKIGTSRTKPNCPGGVCPWTPRKAEAEPEPPQPLKEEKYVKKSRITEQESESDTTASSTIHKGKLFLTVCLGLIIIFGSLAASIYLMYYFGVID